MRKAIGWAAAAVVAATGCGGPVGGGASSSVVDEHKGRDEQCGVCKVTGGGQIEVNGRTLQFSVEAIPVSGPGAGEGFGGQGVAAKGKVEAHVVPANEGTPAIVADVDTILSCGRTGGVLVATFSGSIPGHGRFTASVTDGGEPAHDTIALVAPDGFGPVDVEHGNIQVHELDRCQETCPAGQCLCPDSDHECEPCDAHNQPPPPPPVCGEGMTYDVNTKACEPCASIPPPPPPPPPTVVTTTLPPSSIPR